MLNAKQGSSNSHLLTSFGMTRPGIEPTTSRLWGGRSTDWANTCKCKQLVIYNRAFSLMSCCPPTCPSDCTDWPGYPGHSRAPCTHAIIMCLNHEWRSSWRYRYKQNNVKRCLHKWILIPLLQHAAMLEDIMTSHENALQCVPENRKLINQVNLSEKCKDLFQNSVYPLLTPVTRCIGHAWPSTNHFKWWCQNWFAQHRSLRV